jgi:hypothetical protein
VEGGIGRVLDYLKEGLDVRLNHKVTSVQYDMPRSGGQGKGRGKTMCIVKTANGKTFHANKVIVTAPVAVLQENPIMTFSPALPPLLSQAFRGLQVQDAVKVYVSFNTCFWPPELHGLVAMDAFLPEVWFYTPREDDDFERTHPHKTWVACGFATAANAERILKLSREEITANFCEMLNRIFGMGRAHKVVYEEAMPHAPSNPASKTPYEGKVWVPKDCATPANSDTILGSFVKIWKNYPYARGGYCTGSTGVTRAQRDAFQQPVGRSREVYFAGEGYGSNQINQGGLESAFNCAHGVSRQVHEEMLSDRQTRSRL